MLEAAVGGGARMTRLRRLAPRIVVYDADDATPATASGVLALAMLPAGVNGAAVFGSGSHPTTRLCAATLDSLLRRRRHGAVLDVGTGNGVLARIARARGATFVVATDIDPRALESSRAHAALDGECAPIHVGTESPDHWGARFDLTVANILEAPLAELAPAIVASLAVDGTALISGFTRAQAPALRQRFESVGACYRAGANLEEWCLLSFERRS